jgi:hypothetical protein
VKKSLKQCEEIENLRIGKQYKKPQTSKGSLQVTGALSYFDSTNIRIHNTSGNRNGFLRLNSDGNPDQEPA